MVDPTKCDSIFLHRFFRLPSREIGYLRFLCEGYDGLFFLSSVHGPQGVVEISYSPSRRTDAEALFTALAAEIGLTEVSPPSDAAL